MKTKNVSTVTGTSRKNRLSVMFALVLTVMLALGASQAFAKGDKDGGYYGQTSGGFSGPGPAVVTVEQVKGMSDDARVALRGHIIQSLGGKDYVFKDATGTINVEISNKRWQGQNIGPNDLVEIHGEVDKEWSKLEIEVKRIIKQ
jgi:uncharacterized protein (TIGR00156 family)